MSALRSVDANSVEYFAEPSYVDLRRQIDNLIAVHDARVAELLNANNVMLELRRGAQKETKELKEDLCAVLLEKYELIEENERLHQQAENRRKLRYWSRVDALLQALVFGFVVAGMCALLTGYR